MPSISRVLDGRMTADELREGWRTRSIEAGWAFPSDWYSPAVDALCEAACDAGEAATGVGAELEPAAHRLGHDRARAGVSLAEALADIDVLVDLLPTRAQALTRPLAIGWAEAGGPRLAAVTDGLTGLATPEYLAVRCGEVYRGAEVEGSSAPGTHTLVIARLAGPNAGHWINQMPMILVAESMRTVFSGRQSLARLGPSVAAALVDRHASLPRQVRMLAELLRTRVATGPAGTLTPQVWLEPLPRDVGLLPDLLVDLAR